jgi:hypothetical protein
MQGSMRWAETRAIALWILVAAGLAYGVVNTITAVVDLFGG